MHCIGHIGRKLQVGLAEEPAAIAPDTRLKIEGLGLHPEIPLQEWKASSVHGKAVLDCREHHMKNMIPNPEAFFHFPKLFSKVIQGACRW